MSCVYVHSCAINSELNMASSIHQAVLDEFANSWGHAVVPCGMPLSSWRIAAVEIQTSGCTSCVPFIPGSS